MRDLYVLQKLNAESGRRIRATSRTQENGHSGGAANALSRATKLSGKGRLQELSNP
jgi:hypothetical protein